LGIGIDDHPWPWCMPAAYFAWKQCGHEDDNLTLVIDETEE
jgi:hypothetical protein